MRDLHLDHPTRPTLLRCRTRAGQRRHNWRLPVEPLAEPHDIRRVPAGVEVPGVAFVTAAPHRCDRDAAAIAARIGLRPNTYLSLCVGLGMPGVFDLRPTFGKGAALA